MGSIPTNLRLPEDVRDIYDTLVAAPGRSRNDLMIEALRLVGEDRIQEIALVQKGQDQLRAGLAIPLANVEIELRADGLFPSTTALPHST